jgi:signal transduction histidine kinase
MLSFFVAAWAAMMTLEGLFVIAPSVIAMTSPQRPPVLAQDLEKLAPQLAPSLTTTPPDRARLVALLATFKQPILIPEGVTDNLRSSAAIVPGSNATLFVIGQDGATIASLPATSRSASDLAHIQNTPEARAAVAAALQRGSALADRVRSTSGGLTVAAAPITDTTGVVRGALLLGVDLAALARPMYLLSLLGLAPSAVLFGVIASLFGALFGLLTARGLTRRLSRLTTAATAWSQGDFAMVARDPSNDELGQLARDLNRMAEQLQTLLRDRQQLAAVEERNRLARDLHDSVKQQLFALTMLLGSAQMDMSEQSETRRIIGEAERVAANAQQELTALIHALRPVALTHADMSAALRELCGVWAERSGIALDARIPDGLALSATAEQDVYRIAQEALANIARHSGATRVEVSVERQPDTLTLRIRDNGHGFDVARTDRYGVGLRSMRERIEGLGGTLSVSSSVGGTRIELCVPHAQRQPALQTPTPSGETA